jgi:methylmalonyl-CoA/ethylmalonyl-CoA epimerase
MIPVAPQALVFDHIGIVTANVGKACAQFGAMVGATGATARFDDEVLGVTVQFIRDGSGITYEMIAPLGDASPVAKSLAAKTNLLNQVAYLTPAIAEAGALLRKAGNFPLDKPKPAIAFGGALVQFFFCPLGFVIELIEAPGHRHDFAPFSASALGTPAKGAVSGI